MSDGDRRRRRKVAKSSSHRSSRSVRRSQSSEIDRSEENRRKARPVRLRDSSRSRRSRQSRSRSNSNLGPSRRHGESRRRYDECNRNERRASPEEFHRGSGRTRRRKSSPGRCSEKIRIENIPENTVEMSVESDIRSYCIKEGFSLPESVSLTEEEKSVLVVFPSLDASCEFMDSCDNGTIKINNVDCLVSYSKSDMLPKDENIDAARQRTKGDWHCQCGYSNFSRRQVCYSCGIHRIEGAVEIKINRQTYNKLPINPDLPTDPDLLILRKLSRKSTKESILHILAPGGGIKDIQLCVSSKEIPNESEGRRRRRSDSSDSDYQRKRRSDAKQNVTFECRVTFFTPREKDLAMKRLQMCNYIIDGTKIDVIDSSTPAVTKQVLSGYRQIPGDPSNDVDLPSGTPNFAEFGKDETSGYMIYPGMNMYYDPVTNYFMNNSGSYFLLDEKQSKLVHTYSLLPEEDSTFIAQQQAQALEQAAQSTNDITSLVAEAQKTAQASVEAATSRETLQNTPNNSNLTCPTIVEPKPLNLVFATNVMEEEEEEVPRTHYPQQAVTTFIQAPVAKELAKSLVSRRGRSVVIGNNTINDYINREEVKVDSAVNNDPPVPSKQQEYICYVCIRKFSSKEKLEKHENLSALHKQNLANVT